MRMHHVCVVGALEREIDDGQLCERGGDLMQQFNDSYRYRCNTAIRLCHENREKLKGRMKTGVDHSSLRMQSRRDDKALYLCISVQCDKRVATGTNATIEGFMLWCLQQAKEAVR